MRDIIEKHNCLR